METDAHSDTQDTQPLPAEWNAQSSHAFRYKHSQSSMEYLLKVSRLGNKTIIYGIGMGDDKTTSFDIVTKDYISDSSLPATPVSSSTEDTAHNIQNIFISPSRLTDLGSLLRLNILQKLVPGLQKEGYEESKETSSTSMSATNTSQTQPQATLPPPRRPGDYDPLRDEPLLPRPAQPHNPLADPSFAPRRPPQPTGDFPPPDFEDPYDLNRPPRGMPRPGGNGFTPGYGERDLYPPGMGPNDPLRIGGGGGPGFRGGGGGMYPTFDDPMFGGRGGEEEGFNPQAPPGARWDPLGPGMPRGGGGRFGGGGGGVGGGGRPPNPFGGFGGNDFI